MNARWVVGVLVVCASLQPRPASACGACVVAPSKDPGAVTAHRMAITVRGNETILWDQIVYSGEPEDFVWILPVSAGIEVELAENAFFEALVAQARVQLSGPPVCLPGPAPDIATVSTPSVFEAGPIARPTVRPPDATGRDVSISREHVVGPYETVTLRGEVSEVVSWLVERGYLVPESLVPIIADYAARGMSFAVLRLAPDAGVDRMQPVRIRLPGVSPSLPLRMVAAGVVSQVDLELFVIGEGRYEVAGFGNAEVDRSRIAYDVATRNFNYRDLFDDALFAGDGEGTNWVTEYAAVLDVGAAASFLSLVEGETEPRSAAADVELAVRDLSAPYLTRIRTRLPPSELDEDLSVRASSAADLLGQIAVDRVLNADPSACAPSEAGRLDAGRRTPPMAQPSVICICRSARGGTVPWPAFLLMAALVLRRSAR